jgi:hypothetical protein
VRKSVRKTAVAAACATMSWESVDAFMDILVSFTYFNFNFD